MNFPKIVWVPSFTWRAQWASGVLLVLVLILWPSDVWAREVAPFADPVPVLRPVPGVIEDAALGSGARESIPRIECPPGYTVALYAQGLSAPDGLAFSPSGALHVAEETAGRVSRIAPGGGATPVVSGLANPEGIAFDDAGNLYVVEDVQGGRLVRVTTDGTTTTLATGLDAPEGVVWRAENDSLYITESNAEFASFPQNPLRTHVTVVSPPSGSATRIVTDTLSSYAGITMGPDGLLYVTNEASGLITNASIFSVDPDTGARALFAGDLLAPEGLRFGDGGFPLYVTEEDTGDSRGRLSRVEAGGSHVPFCSGFYSIEDVILDEAGRLYVSEDGSGSIIVIEREARWRVWLPLIRHRSHDDRLARGGRAVARQSLEKRDTSPTRAVPRGC
jgi:sugar lactone lactonase YvrE